MGKKTYGVNTSVLVICKNRLKISKINQHSTKQKGKFMFKKYIILFCSLALLLCSCGKDDDKDKETTSYSLETENITNEIKTSEVSTKEIETFKADANPEEQVVKVEAFNSYSELKQHYKTEIVIPMYSLLGDMCLDEDTIYFSVDYVGALMMNMVSADENLASKIYSYNAKTKESRIVYEAEDGMRRLWRVSTNGTKIVWVEESNKTENEKIYILYCMEIEGGNKEKLCSNEKMMGKIAVTNDYIFWIDEEKESGETKAVYRYDFSTKSTTSIISGISEDSSNDIVSYDNRITIYENKAEESIVSVYDFNGNIRYRFESSGKISNAVSNSKMCVWVNKKTSIDDYEDYEIIIYDIHNDKKYKLDKELDESIALLDNHLIITTDDELLSYKLGDDKEKCITAPDGNGMTKIINVDAYGNVSYIRIDITGGIHSEDTAIRVNVIN